MDRTDTPRPFVPALSRLYAPLSPYAYPFIRICLGLIIARHGYPKLFEGLALRRFDRLKVQSRSMFARKGPRMERIFGLEAGHNKGQSHESANGIDFFGGICSHRSSRFISAPQCLATPSVVGGHACRALRCERRQ